MPDVMKPTLALALFLIVSIAAAATGQKPAPFSPYVDASGGIRVPPDFHSTFVHLGTWVVTSTAAAGTGSQKTGPGLGVHEVYTQASSLDAYRKTGTWPDGAVLVQEVRAMNWDDLPTGHVIYQGDAVKWFVMVKDARNRFPDNPHWGDGWGWALFTPPDTKANVSTDYKQDCAGCHEVAKDTDRVFIHGYPALK